MQEVFVKAKVGVRSRSAHGLGSPVRISFVASALDGEPPTISADSIWLKLRTYKDTITVSGRAHMFVYAQHVGDSFRHWLIFAWVMSPRNDRQDAQRVITHIQSVEEQEMHLGYSLHYVGTVYIQSNWRRTAIGTQVEISKKVMKQIAQVYGRPDGAGRRFFSRLLPRDRIANLRVFPPEKETSIVRHYWLPLFNTEPSNAG